MAAVGVVNAHRAAAGAGGVAPAYRPDIDGLRALAVLAVILFHAQVPGFSGGFVGVDVFFVISGYLITQLLLVSHADTQPRRLAEFYLRRARRILPALLVVCLVTFLVSLWLLLPESLVYLGKHLAAAPLLLSNLAAWSDGGYFGPGQTVALGHLWSVAVEEQFYLVYPLLLLLLVRYLPARRAAALAVLAVASLLLCLWAARYRPAVNYFAAPTRAWELLLGALLALRGSRVRAAWVEESGAFLCLAVLIGVAFVYDPGLPYPGAYTLAPCLATAGLIESGRLRRTWVAHVLAWRPLVFLGLISYSLYLWHQPLLQWLNYWHVTPVSPALRALALAATGLLATLSWRYIEQPVRRRRILRSVHGLVLAAVAGSALVCLSGVALWRSDGFPQRFAASTRSLLGDSWVDPGRLREVTDCLEKSAAAIRAGAVCQYGLRPPGAPAVLLWGDSHALALLPGVIDVSAPRGRAVYLVATSSCRPLLDVINLAAGPAGNPKCAPFNAAAVAAVARLAPTEVLLVGYWAGDRLRQRDTGEEGVGEFGRALRNTVSAITSPGRAVCVVLDVPLLPYAVSYGLAMAQRRGIADDFLAISRGEAYAAAAPWDTQIRSLARTGVVRVADPKGPLCSGTACLYKLKGRALYNDRNHLSEFGAHYVAPALEPCFAAAAAP